MAKDFKKILKEKIDKYVHFAYQVTKKFPKDELYGVTSQFRRSSVSVILNYIEGYARIKPAVQLNFLEIAYGSLKESEYLFDFSYKENYLTKEEKGIGEQLADEIGAMLWTEINSLQQSVKKS